LGNRILSGIKLRTEPSQISTTGGRMYQASGPKCHKKDRQQSVIPEGLPNVDTESSWSKSHYRGWVQGYRLMLQTLCFPGPVPLFDVRREKSRLEAAILLEELEANRLHVPPVNLGDVRLAELGLPEKYREKGGWLLTPKESPNKIILGNKICMSFAKKLSNCYFSTLCKPSIGIRNLKRPKIAGGNLSHL
jgi:hypothetical protein